MPKRSRVELPVRLEVSSEASHAVNGTGPGSRGPLLISARELATMLGISVRTVWRKVSGGELMEPVRIGRCTRWRLQEINEWIDAGCPPVEQSARKGGR